jgi:uncharacterized protein
VIVYFDSSALVKMVMAEEGRDLAVEIWEQAAWRATSHVTYSEARAALAAAERRGRIDRAALRDATVDLERLSESMELMTVAHDVAWRAGGLAERHALRGYDAIHLASMVGMDGPRVVVATWDKKMALAASQCGLAVIPDPPRWEVERAEGEAGPPNRMLV